MQQLIEATAESTAINQSYVYKDYFACMALKEVITANPLFVFKGGTALSKCYGIIDRFSEDVDLGLDTFRPTEGMRKRTKAAVLAAMDKLGLAIDNLQETRSRREFNQYLISLPQRPNSIEPEILILETGLMTSTSPSQRGEVISFVGEYLLSQGRQDVVDLFGLERFEVNVVCLERTFADKAFAIADYYLNGEIPFRQSRHVYDLCKLEQNLVLDAGLAELMRRVRKEREGGSKCASAAPGVSLAAVLQEVLEKQIYRHDYEEVTMPLLFEAVDYDTAASVIPKIIDFLDEYPLN